MTDQRTTDDEHDDAEDRDDDPRDREKGEGLPPNSSTKGDPGSSLRGNDREAAPYEEAPAQGRLAPEGDNPPP
jgi:hypothetical protein